MAAKVNTKLVLIIILVLGLAAIPLGAMYYLSIYRNAERHVRQGDEAAAAGAWENAYSFYALAAQRAPTNREYITKAEQALRKIRPDTPQKAFAYYREVMRSLEHMARLDASNPEAHTRYVNELYSLCRRQPSAHANWNTLAAAADNMLKHLPESEPTRLVARSYKGMPDVYRMRSIEEVKAAANELRAVTEAVPDHDQTWATLLFAEMVIAQKLEEAGATESAIAEQYAKVDETATRALRDAPQGIETARMYVLRMMARRDADPESVTDEELKAAGDRMEALLSLDMDPGLVNDVLDTLSAVPPDGFERAVSLLKRCLEKDPDAIDKRLMLGVLSMSTGEIDLAEQSAKVVLESEPQPVGFLAQIQDQLRRQAAGLMMDIENYRWEAAPAEQKAAQLQAMQAARARLHSLVSDKQNDPLLTRADGLIAFANAEFAKAASLFEKLVRESNSRDSRVLASSSYCLAKVNEIGKAHERLSQALALNPRPIHWHVQKAALEFSMGRDQEASATLAAINPERLAGDAVSRARAQEIQAAIQVRAQGQTDGSLDNPLTNSIVAAGMAMNRGDLEAARATLLTALETNPDNLRLLQMLVRLEVQDGKVDKATEYLQRALAIEPDNAVLRGQEASLKYKDPVEAVREFCKVAYQNDKERLIATMVNLGTIVLQQEGAARAMEASPQRNDAAIAAAREVGSRAAAEADAIASQIEQIDAANSQCIEYRFVVAVMKRDWPAAEAMLARAKASNADQAGGQHYLGRYEMARADAAASSGDRDQSRRRYQAAALALESAAEAASFSSSIWRNLASVYITLGNFIQAQRALEQAYRNNPNNLSVARGYVEILMRRGEKVTALRVLRHARHQAPADAWFRERWLELEAEVGDRNLALQTRQERFRSTPEDSENAVQLATLLGETPPSLHTIVDDQGKPVYTEQRWTRMTNTERDQVIEQTKAEWLKTADQVLTKAAGLIKDDSAAALEMASARAKLLRNRGDVFGGERLLREFIAAFPKEQVTVDMLIALGQYQISRNHFTEAIATLLEATALQDAKLRQADHALGALYFELAQYQKALDHLNQAYEANPDPATNRRIIECLVRLKRLDEADQRLAQAIDESSKDPILTMLKATILEHRADELLIKGDESGADRMFLQQRETLAQAEAEDPSSPMPRILLAQSFLREYNRRGRTSLLDDALRALDRAEKIRADAPDASRLRVHVLRAQKNTSGAVAELRRILQREPTNTIARRELTLLYLEQRDFDSAMEVIDEAIRLNPSTAAWYDLKGDLIKGVPEKRDASLAVEAYAKAYDLSGSSVALLKLVDVMMAIKDNCKAVIDRLADAEAALDEQPAVREYYGRALDCVGRRSEALEQFRKSYQKRKELAAGKLIRPDEMSEWFRMVTYIFQTPGGGIDASGIEQFAIELSAGNPDVQDSRFIARAWLLSSPPNTQRSIELARRALELCPADDRQLNAEINADLAKYLMMAGDNNAAVVCYEKLLEFNPNHVEALNNVAYFLADDQKQPARALTYALKAAELAPRDASVLDTLGWVQYLAGDYDKARQSLAQSLEISPLAPTHVHMAQALIKTGDATGALRHLDEARKLKPDAATLKEIERLENEIRNGRTPGN